MKIYFNAIIFTLLISSVLSCSKFFESDKDIYNAWVDNLRVRETPSLDGKIVSKLKIGEEVLYLDYASETFESIELSGIETHGTWFKVKTKNNKIGWVYSGALSMVTKIDNLKLYAIKDIFYIFSEKENKIIFKEKVDVKDDGYISSIDCNKAKGYYIITLRPPMDFASIYIGIFDIKKNKWANKIFGYALYEGMSPSGKYLAFTGGSRSDSKGFSIFSLEKMKLIFETNQYYLDGKWKYDNSIELAYSVGSEYPNKPTLNPGYETYVKKVIWKNEKLIETDIVTKERIP